MRVSVDDIEIIKVEGSTIGVNTTAYADNDLVGEQFEMKVGHEGKGVVLQGITLHDIDSQTAILEIVIWGKDPSGSTFTNNSAVTVVDADLPTIQAVVNVAAADYVAFADNSIAIVKDLVIPLKSEAGNKYYVLFRSNGSTPTYTASGLSATFLFLIAS